jgi:AcrR family transcriptional regulator
VLSAAGVSRATFYQYFSNVEDCFWSAYRHHADQLLPGITSAARGAPERELSVLHALAAMAASHPETCGLLMREGLAAGPGGLLERDALISRIEHAMRGAAPSSSTVDLPPAILIGGSFRFLAMRLSDASPFEDVSEDLRNWVDAFRRGSSKPSWSARLAVPSTAPAPRSCVRFATTRPAGAPRERILRATAAIVRDKGYCGLTVASIVQAAGISRRTFYTHYNSKADASVAVFEDGLQKILAACTPAYFSGGSWPERVWRSAQAFTAVLERAPCLSHLGFVEAQAIDHFTARVHQTQLAFTLFLEEGYRQTPEAQRLPRACSALTATSIMELFFCATRRGPALQLRRSQPLAVFIALAPFIGLDAAGEFVIGKLSETGSAAPALA